MTTLKLHVTVGDTELGPSTYQQLKPKLQSSDIQEVFSLTQADYQLVLGGDGTMLKAAQNHITETDLPPLFGIKAGHPKSQAMTLNEVSLDISADHLAEMIQEAIFSCCKFLEADIGNEKPIYAFNDIRTFRSSPQSIYENITLSIPKECSNLPESYEVHHVGGDGSLVCTAQGSAAYNLSAGGKAFTDLNNIQLTGICSSINSIHLSQGSEIKIEPLQQEKRPRRIEYDDEYIDWPPKLEALCIKLSEKVARIGFIQGKSLKQKLAQEALSK